MRKSLIISLFIFLVIVFCLVLSFISEIPIAFSMISSISLSGLLIEFIGLILAVCFVYLFYKKYGLYDTLSFFIPIFLIGIVIEGNWIVNQRFTFHKLNFYFWNVPIVIILYYSGVYLLLLLYKKLGKGLINRIKGIIIHLFVDVFITTPLAILFGFWTFKSTLLNHYPYIVPNVHIGEVVLGLFYILFQERLIDSKKVKKELKPIISLTVVFCLLLIYLSIL